MRVPTRLPIVATLVAALAVSGCKTPEEKAQEFYLSGIEFVKADDPARAMIQFRNALLHVPTHREAALARVELLRAQGDEPNALAGLKALSEQFPQDMELRHLLLSFVLRREDWEEVLRQADAILATAPESAEAQVAEVVKAYRSASLSRDTAQVSAAAARAIALRAERPFDDALLRVVLDWYAAVQDYTAAIDVLDTVLARDPENREFQLTRVALLARIGAQDIAGDRLRSMVALFPEDRRIRGLFVAWLVSEGETDAAEQFLRQLADGPLDRRQALSDVVSFVEVHRGPEAADAEIANLVVTAPPGPDQRHWRAVQAMRLFSTGGLEEAVAQMRRLVDEEDNGDARRALQVTLARMLGDVGAAEEADSLIEAVLKDAPLQSDALQFRAMRLLGAGRTTQAISDLRSALAQRPRDPEILGLMARVHLVEGNRELAGERLASAVEASAHAPRPSLTYAAFLRQDGRDEVAERILRAAVERAPRAGAIKAALAELLIDFGRFGEAALLIEEIAQSDVPQDAVRLHARRLAAQGRQAEGLNFLRGLSAEGLDRVRPIASIVQTLVRAGRAAEALAYLDAEAGNPEDAAALQLLRASVHAYLGDVANAEAALLDVVAQKPGNAHAVSLLVPLLRARGAEAQAEEVLAAALAASPNNRPLRLMEASRREARGDIPGAIDLLTVLHKENSADLLAANNLASLLTQTQPGPTAPDGTRIDAARSAARVLRGLPEPAFQDTYGWVEFLRGNLGEALSYLEPAAEALPGDPRVQYHLGRVYEALGRAEAAAAQFQRVAALDKAAALPETQSARARLTQP